MSNNVDLFKAERMANEDILPPADKNVIALEVVKE